MLFDCLHRPLWYSTLAYSTASDLLRLQRCSRWCRDSLLDPSGAEQLLRRYFRLDKQQLTNLYQPATVTVQRLLAPLASLERQLGSHSPSALHRALFIHAICASALSLADLSQPHSAPVPALQYPANQLWELFDYCPTADPRELTLSCVGLPWVQLWLHAPFWRRGWSDYLYLWMHSDCAAMDNDRAIRERDDVCAKLDRRVRWIGSVQPDPSTVLAVGLFGGAVRRCVHRVPDTFMRPGYDVHFAHSDSSEEECASRRAGGATELPVVTLELSGGMEEVNGHKLHVYDSLGAFLLSRAQKDSEQAVQRVQQFVREAEADTTEHQPQSGEEAGDLIGDSEESTGLKERSAKADEAVRGLPLYLSCFPMPDSILWSGWLAQN